MCYCYMVKRTSNYLLLFLQTSLNQMIESSQRKNCLMSRKIEVIIYVNDVKMTITLNTIIYVNDVKMTITLNTMQKKC